ncbi:hypothetical protein [Brucella anthropi]|uniref:hypothetical protein n=1 Tax=Brucella anthropi TaxID=529 RepID=UPI000CFE1815|nr:hypothetical protein [Ochrobactrum sp. MYb49]PQZ67238.1 hypothetical protein CQ057_12495 [Ochrobactrum sp. MYb49]
MSIMENTAQRPNGFEGRFMLDDALEAEIRAHLRFTRSLGRFMICGLSVLLCGAAFHFSAISF